MHRSKRPLLFILIMFIRSRFTANSANESAKFQTSDAIPVMEIGQILYQESIGKARIDPPETGKKKLQAAQNEAYYKLTVLQTKHDSGGVVGADLMYRESLRYKRQWPKL